MTTHLPSSIDEVSIYWQKRRWTVKHAWYRIRLIFRRKRWKQSRAKLAQHYAKLPAVRFTPDVALVFGDFSGNNGLSRAAIYDLKELERTHSRVIPIDISNAIEGKACRLMALEQFKTAYFFCQPDMYEHVFPLVSSDALRHAYRIGRWVWETPQFPSSWDFAESLVHEVWAASEFCGNVFRSHLSIPVRIVPHAVTAPAPATVDVRSRFGIAKNAFLGLAIMDIRSCPERKNPWAHVLAWKHAFGDIKDAVLILKIRTSKRSHIVEQELSELIGNSSNIKILNVHLSEAEINSLRHSCEVFLSLHRSEGYGLNIHEALLCGKPTLATHWSANTEYGPSFPHYRGIKFRMVQYNDWTGHYEDPNFYWADPDIEDAAVALREIFVSFRSKSEYATKKNVKNCFLA